MEGLELGKRYRWEEVLSTYPDRWVRMSDCELTSGADIITGILVGVYTDAEAGEARIKMWNEHSDDQFVRTKLEFNSGVINCLNAKLIVKNTP